MVFVQRDGVESRKLTHSNDMCVACGICTDCCPTGSLSLNDVLAIRRGFIKHTMTDKLVSTT